MNQQSQRVVVTGLGVLSGNAHGINNYNEALKNGISGVRYISHMDEMGFAGHVGSIPKNLDQLANKYFSEAWGDSLQEFVSVSESKEEEPLDLLNMLTGNDRLLFSVSTQLTPRCPVDAFHSLRRGGKANRLCVDFFLTQAGRTYGPDHSPYKLVTFKQV